MKSQPCLVLLIYNFPTEIFKNFFHYWLLTFTAWKVWEFFLVHIFSYSKWIWRDTEYAGKYGPDKTLYLDTFHAVFKDIPSKVSNIFLLEIYNYFEFVWNNTSDYRPGGWYRLQLVWNPTIDCRSDRWYKLEWLVWGPLIDSQCSG